jgi:type IX secretion system PorP/SprF family membrane protein
VVIKPSVLLKYLPASPLQYDVTGTFYVSKLLGVGFGYRSSDAIYALLDIKITDQFNLGYSYDFTTSKLKNYSGGSHELMLRYLFKYSVNSKSVRYF